MTTRYLAAAVQMHSGEDRAANLATATHLVEAAASLGARLVVLPEFFNGLGRLEKIVEQAETIPGETSEAMRRLAERLEITLVAGSICEQSDEPGKGYNTSLMFGPDGRLLARYRKLHLFDVDVPNMITHRESKCIIAGEKVSATKTPLGCLGQATCYDLRFPELFRLLADRAVEVVAFPSAFSAPTGKVHWEVLLRARAIENQVYIVAANQYGQHTPKLATYGHSMIVDPWGEILASAEEEEAVLVAEINLEKQAEIRRGLPVLTHRRRLGG